MLNVIQLQREIMSQEKVTTAHFTPNKHVSSLLYSSVKIVKIPKRPNKQVFPPSRCWNLRFPMGTVDISMLFIDQASRQVVHSAYFAAQNDDQ